MHPSNATVTSGRVSFGPSFLVLVARYVKKHLSFLLLLLQTLDSGERSKTTAKKITRIQCFCMCVCVFARADVRDSRPATVPF